MEFHNPTELARFVSDNDLVRLNPIFPHLVGCINNYAVVCSCTKREDKLKLYETCVKLYMDSAKHIVARYKTEFFSKTSEASFTFYTEQGQLITIVSR